MDMLPESRTDADYSYNNELLINVSFNPLTKSEDGVLQNHLENRITSALSDSGVSKPSTPEFRTGLSTVTEVLPQDHQQTVNSLQGFVQPESYTISISNLTAMVYGPDESCLNPVTDIYSRKYTSVEERMGQDGFMSISFTLTFNHKQDPITTDVEYENVVTYSRLTHLTEVVRRCFDESDIQPGAREVLSTLDSCLTLQGDDDDPGTWCNPPRSHNRAVSSSGDTSHGIGTMISSRITVPSWTENLLQIREPNSRSVLVSSELRYSSHWFRTTDYQPETKQLDFSQLKLSIKPITIKERISMEQIYPCLKHHRILHPCISLITGDRTTSVSLSPGFKQMKVLLRFVLQGTVYSALFSSSDPVIVTDDSFHINSLANPSATCFPFPGSSTPRLILPTCLPQRAPNKPLNRQTLQSLVSDVHEFRLTTNFFSKLGKRYYHSECSCIQPYNNNEKGTKTPFLFDFDDIKTPQQRQMSNQDIPAFETFGPSDDESPVHFFVELHNKSNEEAGSQRQMFLGRRSDRSERRSRPSSTELPLPKRIIGSIRRSPRIETLLDVNGSVASGRISSSLSKREQPSTLTSYTEPTPGEGLIREHRESVSVLNEAQGPANQGHLPSVGPVNVLNLPESGYPLSSHFSKQDVTDDDPVGTSVREGRHTIPGGAVDQHKQSETRRSPSLGRRTTFRKRLSSFRRSVNLREMMESCWKADVNDNPVGISDSAQKSISLSESNLVSLHGTDVFLEEPPKWLAPIDGKQKESSAGSAEHSSVVPVSILNELGSDARLNDNPDETPLELLNVHPTILSNLPNPASSKDSSKPAVDPHLTSGDQISDEESKQHASILASPEDTNNPVPGAFDYAHTSDTTGDDCDNPTDTSYADTNRVCFVSEGQASLSNQLEINRISIRTGPLSVQYVPNRPGNWSSLESNIDNGTHTDSTGPVAHISRPQQSQERAIPRRVSPLSELLLSGTHSVDSLSAYDMQRAYAQLSVCMLPEQDAVRYDKGEKVVVSGPPSNYVCEFVQKIHKQKAQMYNVKEVPVLSKPSRPDVIHGPGESPQLVATEQSFDQNLLCHRQLVEGNPVPFAVTTGTNRLSFSEDGCKSLLGKPRTKDSHTDSSVIDPVAGPNYERSSKRSHMTFYQIPSIEMEPSISVRGSPRLPLAGQHTTVSSRCTLATGISDSASDRLNGEEVHDIQSHETPRIQNISSRKHQHCPNRRKSGNDDSHSETCLCEFLTPIFPAIPDNSRKNGLTNLIQVEELEALQRNVTAPKAVEVSPQRTIIIIEDDELTDREFTVESLPQLKTLEASREDYTDDHLLNKPDSGSDRLKTDENHTYQTPQVYVGKGSDTQDDGLSGSPRSPSSDYRGVHSSGKDFKSIDRPVTEQLNSPLVPTISEQSSQRKPSTIAHLEVSQWSAVHDTTKRSAKSNEETGQVQVGDISSIVTHKSSDPETLVDVATNFFTTKSVKLEAEKSEKVGSQLNGFHCLCQPRCLCTERLQITPVSPKPSEYPSRIHNRTHSDYRTTSLNTEMHSEVRHLKSEPVVLDGAGLSTNEKNRDNYVPTKVESPNNLSEMQITASLPASQLLPELVCKGYHYPKADACRAVSTALPKNIKQDNPQTKCSISEPKTCSSADTSRLLSRSSPTLTTSTGSTYYTAPPPIQRNVTERTLVSGPLGEVLSPTLSSTPSTSSRWKLGLPKTDLKIGANSWEVADSGPVISSSREVLYSFQPLFSWDPYPNDRAVVTYPPVCSDPTRATSLETDRCEPISASPTPKVTNTLPAPKCTCRKSRSLSPGPHVIHSSTVIALNHLHCLHNGCVPFRSSSSQRCPVEQHTLDNPGGNVCIHTSIGLNKAPGTCQYPVCCPKFGVYQPVPCEHCRMRKTASSGPGMNGSHGFDTANTAPNRTHNIVALPERHKQANPVFSTNFTVPQTSESPSSKYGFVDCKVDSGHSVKVAVFSNNRLYGEMNRSELDSQNAVRNDRLGSPETLGYLSKREAAECTIIQKPPNQDPIQVNPNSKILTCQEKSRVLSPPAAPSMGSEQHVSTHPSVIYSAQEHDTVSHRSNYAEMQLSRDSFPSDQQTLVPLTGGTLAHFSNNYYASERMKTVYRWINSHKKKNSCDKSDFLNCDTPSATEDSSEIRRPDHSEPSNVTCVNELPSGECTNKYNADLPMITSPVVIEPHVNSQQAVADQRIISANRSSVSTVSVVDESVKKVQAEESTNLKQITDQANQIDLPQYVSHIERDDFRTVHSRNEPADQSSPASVDHSTHAVKNPGHLSASAKAGFDLHSANLPLLPSPVGTIDYLQHFRKISAASSKGGLEQRGFRNTDSLPMSGIWNKSYSSLNCDPMEFANSETVQTKTVEFTFPSSRCRQKENENQSEKGCDIKPTISVKALGVRCPVVRNIHSLECCHCRFKTTHSSSDSSFSSVADTGRYTQHEVTRVKVDSVAGCSRAISASSYSSRRIRSQWTNLERPVHNTYAEMTPKSRSRSLQSSKNMLCRRPNHKLC